MRASRTIVVGSYNQDFVWRCARFPEPGETLRALDFSSGSGGKGSNQAIACARQQVSTCFIGAIGADAAGEVARRLAQREGVDARWQICAGADTGNACVLVDAQGRNLVTVHTGANQHLDAAHVRAQSAAFSGARVVLVQLETALEPLRAAFDLAGAAQALRLLNPAPARADLDASLLSACDLLIPNETECAELLRQYAGIAMDAGQLAALPDAELTALIAHLPCASVLVTLGAAGAFVAHRDGPRLGDRSTCYRMPPVPARVQDTTGAGDAFCGALAAALTVRPDAPLRTAVEYASRCAALSTERCGATTAPTRAEVVQRFGACVE